jgi:hypothetical protein
MPTTASLLEVPINTFILAITPFTRWLKVTMWIKINPNVFYSRVISIWSLSR